VHVSHCTDDIVEYLAGRGLGEVLVLHDDIEQLPSRTHFGQDVDVVIVLEVLVHLHDVGVVLSRGGFTSSRRMLNSLMTIFSSRIFLRRSIFFMARRLPAWDGSYL
jgi:2-polyprenyl-3-methyl-5-hydroxy-6-metoxy-1,4-benzoquinol methylase